MALETHREWKAALVSRDALNLPVFSILIFVSGRGVSEDAFPVHVGCDLSHTWMAED